MFNNTYLGDRSLAMPPAIRLLPNLDPANDAEDKRKFFMRVRS